MLPGDWLPCGQHQWAAPRWPRGLHSASSPQVITRALGGWEGIESGPCSLGPPGQVHQVLLPTHPSIHSSIHPPIHLPTHSCILLSIHSSILLMLSKYLLCARNFSKYWGM
jgi:hypothetical protein